MNTHLLLINLIILWAVIYWSFRLGNFIAIYTKISITTFIIFVAMIKFVLISYD